MARTRVQFDQDDPKRQPALRKGKRYDAVFLCSTPDGGVAEKQRRILVLADPIPFYEGREEVLWREVQGGAKGRCCSSFVATAGSAAPPSLGMVAWTLAPEG